jgi:uncharacterized protein (DUF1800 family)
VILQLINFLGKQMNLRCPITGIVGFLVFISASTSPAILDYTGEGVSEIWKIENVGVAFDESDEDGDGVSNYDEMLAGTNPRNDQDRLELKMGGDPDNGAVSFQWKSVGGKVYTIERLEPESGNWLKHLNLFPEVISRPRSIPVPLLLEKEVFRLTVRDIDVDGDGLTAWEEVRLGTSDLDMMSGSRDEGILKADYARLVGLLENPEGVSLIGGEILPQRLPDEDEAARFLMKSSFGPTDESIAEVAQRGWSGWIDDQFAMPNTKSAEMLERNGFEDLTDAWRYAWWRLINTAPDQLRQRMAYALGQILVVDFSNGTVVGSNPKLQAHYYDFFMGTADRTYRDILEDVAYSPVMGWYLSHLQNRKADPEINRFPDENFAREIMQLFTVGLWELEMDGTRKLDDLGDPIPTYDNDEITEMARVFTGMSYSTTNNGTYPATWFFNVGLPPEDWQNRMRFFEKEHDDDAKTILGGVEIQAGQSGEEDVRIALDALCAYPSSAPFLSHLLIQRFTGSNPTPEYIRRVAGVWVESGGNLDQVLRAILLDPESLFEQSGDAAGKLREPILKFSHFSRAFNFQPPNPDRWSLEYQNLRGVFGQYGMMAPSVFNFYLPDFSPQGEIRERGLTSPESEIITFSNVVGTSNTYLSSIERGYNDLRGKFAPLVMLISDVPSGIAYLNRLLTGGRLTSANIQRIVETVQLHGTLQRRIEVAVHLVTQCPEFSVIK